MAKIELAAPKGKFKVIKWVEDLDTIDPVPDFPVELGIVDNIQEAEQLKSQNKRAFSTISVYNDKGERVI